LKGAFSSWRGSKAFRLERESKEQAREKKRRGLGLGTPLEKNALLVGLAPITWQTFHKKKNSSGEKRRPHEEILPLGKRKHSSLVGEGKIKRVPAREGEGKGRKNRHSP